MASLLQQMVSTELDPATPQLPIGTLVIRIDDLGRPHLTRTRSECWVVSGHWMVKVYGPAGGYMLSRIFVMPDLEELT